MDSSIITKYLPLEIYQYIFQLLVYFIRTTSTPKNENRKI